MRLRLIALSGTAGRQEAWLWWGPSFLVALAVGIDPLGLPLWVFPLFALVNLGATTALVRRAHDTGRTGWWVALTAVPVAGTLVAIWLLFAKPRRIEAGRFARRRAYLWGQAALLLLTLFIASRAFWVPYWIPSGSMKPALLVGDFVITRPVSGADLVPGDIVVFLHPTRDEHFVKRVIAGPGDRVALQGGRVVINGAALAQTPLGDFVEPRGPQGALGLRPRCLSRERDLCHKAQAIEIWPMGCATRCSTWAIARPMTWRL